MRFGSLLSTSDSLGHVLSSATYDYGSEAFQRTFTDADMGHWSYTYDALGEMTAYSDARTQNFSVTYDALSRPLVRTERTSSQLGHGEILRRASI